MHVGVLLCNGLCISVLFVGECLFVGLLVRSVLLQCTLVCSIVLCKGYRVPVSVCTGVSVRFG